MNKKGKGRENWKENESESLRGGGQKEGEGEKCEIVIRVQFFSSD